MHSQYPDKPFCPGKLVIYAKLLASAAALIGASCIAEGTTFTWDEGAGNDNWSAANNWDLDSGVPDGSDDDAILTNFTADGDTVIVDATYTLGSVTINSDYNITVDQITHNLILDDDDGTTEFTVSSGTTGAHTVTNRHTEYTDNLVVTNDSSGLLTFYGLEDSSATEDRSVTFAGSGDIQINNYIQTDSATTSTGSVVMNGTGTLEFMLDVTQRWNGGLTINSGTVKSDNVVDLDRFGAGAIVVNNGGTLKATELLGGTEFSQDITVNAGGIADFDTVANYDMKSGSINFAGTVTMDTSSEFANNGATINVTGGTFDVRTGSDFDFWNAGSHINQTGGTITVDETNISTNKKFDFRRGTITVDGSSTVFNNYYSSNTFNTGTLNLTNNSVMNNTADVTLGSSLTFNGSGSGTTSGTLRITDSNLTITNGITINNSPNIEMYGTGTINMNTASTVAFGHLVKEGGGTTTIGTNFNTGGLDAERIIVNDGTLLLSEDEAIADTAELHMGGGTLDTASYDETLDSLTLTADSTIDLGSGTKDIIFDTAFNLTSGTLRIENWDGTMNTAGTANRRILLAFDPGVSYYQNIYFAGNTYGGANVYSIGGGLYEIVAAPEPSTFIALLAFASAACYTRTRKKQARQA